MMAGLRIGFCIRATLLVLVLPTAVGAQSAITSTDKDRPLASIGEDATITLDELIDRSPKLESLLQQGGIETSDLQAEVEETIRVKLAAKEALALGLDQRPLIQAHLEDILSLAYLRENIPDSVLEVSDQEVEEFYQTNLEQFALPRRMLLRHVLVGSESEASAIRAELRNMQTPDLSDFANRSLDPTSKETRGELPWTIAEGLMPPLGDVVRKLAVGEITEPVKSALGYHILQLVDIAPVEYRPLSEIRQDVGVQAQSDKKRRLVDELIASLWAKYDVDVKADVIETVAVASQRTRVAGEEASIDQDDSEPRFLLLSRGFDLGTLLDEETTFSVVFGNPGGAPLEIKSVRTTCSCLDAGVSVDVLQPGEFATLDVVVLRDKVPEEGLSVERIGIETNAPRERLEVVEVSLFVE